MYSGVIYIKTPDELKMVFTCIGNDKSEIRSFNLINNERVNCQMCEPSSKIRGLSSTRTSVNYLLGLKT